MIIIYVSCRFMGIMILNMIIGEQINSFIGMKEKIEL